MKTLTSEKNHAPSADHKLRSSNLPFYEAIWNVAKRIGSITAVRQRIRWDEEVSQKQSFSEESRASVCGAKDDGDQPNLLGDQIKQTKAHDPNPSRRSKRIDVDVIANCGAEWIKVSLINEKQLLHDLVKQGWNIGDHCECEDDGSHFEKPNDMSFATGFDYDVPVIRTARNLQLTAKQHWYQFRRPQTRLVLPRIHSGRISEIDMVIERIRALGCQVDLASDDNSPFCDLSQMPSFTAVLPHLAVPKFPNFSKVLNIDCSILIALISDISHIADLETHPLSNSNIRQFVEFEAKERLLPIQLYPAMSDRELVCTSEAAEKTKEIAQALGTDTERRRAEVLLGDPLQLSQEEALAQMATLSDYQVMSCWKIPVKVVERTKAQLSHQRGFPTAIAHKVASQLSELNQSIFINGGWVPGCTTLTSNRAVAKQIEVLVREAIEKGEACGYGLLWPHMWVNTRARSLVGREKESAEREGRARALPKPSH